MGPLSPLKIFTLKMGTSCMSQDTPFLSFYFHVQNNSVKRNKWQSVPKPNKIFFHNPWIPKNLKNRLISRDPQMLEPGFWSQNSSIYGALMLLHFF